MNLKDFIQYRKKLVMTARLDNKHRITIPEAIFDSAKLKVGQTVTIGYIRNKKFMVVIL